VKRILAVNYKAYETAFNEVGAELAKASYRLSSKHNNVRIILAVPSIVLEKVSNMYDDVFLQHIDSLGFGAHTGFLPVESLKHSVARGSLINHSEHKLAYRDIEGSINVLKSIGKESIACADTPGEALGLAYLKPDMIAIEPPELIGTGIPVSKAKPEVITESIKAVKSVGDVAVLAGAGITVAEDATRAIELGAKGVLVASAIMKSKDPIKVLNSFVESMDTF